MKHTPNIAADGWITSDSLPALPYDTRVHVRLSGIGDDPKATLAGFWRDACRPRIDGHGCKRVHVTHYRLAGENVVNLPARLDRIAQARAA